MEYTTIKLDVSVIKKKKHKQNDKVQILHH